MAQNILEITDPFEIQRIAEVSEDVEELSKLQLLVIQGNVGNSNQRETLRYFLKGRIRKLTGK